MLLLLLLLCRVLTHLRDQLVRVRVPVVLPRKVGRDGRHGYPDVGVLDAVSFRELVHDRFRLLGWGVVQTKIPSAGQSVRQSVSGSVGQLVGL